MKVLGIVNRICIVCILYSIVCMYSRCIASKQRTALVSLLLLLFLYLYSTIGYNSDASVNVVASIDLEVFR